jgi:hypothetical protein
MDKINDLENENNLNSNNNNNNNVSTYMNNSQYGNNSSVILNNSQTNNQSVNILNSSDKLPGGVNINEIVKENEDIKNQYENILQLKKNYKNKKIQNQKLVKTINEMNTNCFLFKKIFNEGMHEIGKELLKIHELKLDKVINGSNNNKKANSLYFQIVKDKLNGNEKKNDETLKLPLINKNIAQKYNYPIVEKSNPNTLIYNVIRNILDENHNSNRISNIKKNKISWEEFKNFSAYQMYSILNLNKEIIKKIEGNIFPRKIIFSSAPTQEDDELINSKNVSEIHEINEEFNDDYGLYFCKKNIEIESASEITNKKCSPNEFMCKNCMEKNKKMYHIKKKYLININGRVAKINKGSYHCFGHFLCGNQIEDCITKFTCEACKLLNLYSNYFIQNE